MSDYTPAAMNLAEIAVEAYPSENIIEIDDAGKVTVPAVLTVARALDDAGVREAIKQLTIGSKGGECPHCESALAALNGTQEKGDG